MSQYILLAVVFAISFALYYAVKDKYKRFVLLAAIIAFYWFTNIPTCIGALLVTAFAYVQGIRINKNIDNYHKDKESITSKEDRKALKAKYAKRNNIIIVFSSIIIFGIMLIVKNNHLFYGLTDIIEDLFNAKDISWLSFAGALGFEWLALKSVAYLVDLSQEKYIADKSFCSLVLSFNFFLLLKDGPLERYETISDQLNIGKKFNFQNIKEGIILIAFGLFEKLVVSARLYKYYAEVLDNYYQYSSLTMLTLIPLMAILIYASFAGSIALVTGLARFYGIRLSLNFKTPFYSTSTGEFWRRWHITFSSWLRDYIFYPICLSSKWKKVRKSKSVVAREMPFIIANFCVWMFMALWHRATIALVIYGLFWFVIALVDHYIQPSLVKFRGRLSSNGAKVYDRFMMLLVACILGFGVALSMSDAQEKSLEHMMGFYRQMFTNPSSLSQFASEVSSIFTKVGLLGAVELVFVIVGTIVMALVDMYEHKNGETVFAVISRMDTIKEVIIVSLVIVIAAVFSLYGPLYW